VPGGAGSILVKRSDARVVNYAGHQQNRPCVEVSASVTIEAYIGGFGPSNMAGSRAQQVARERDSFRTWH
jgi:hypothetical protein